MEGVVQHQATTRVRLNTSVTRRYLRVGAIAEMI